MTSQHTPHQAFNVSSFGRHNVTNRASVMGWPMWAGMATSDQAARIKSELWKDDMLSPWGVRSVSNRDPRYTNANVIKPYSNWAGPIWVNANVVLSYGLMRYGYKDDAALLAERVVGVLQDDLDSTGTWHEAYSSDTGLGTSAPQFLSWNTLGCAWQEQLIAGKDPFEL
jgi:putative isomerase